MAETEKKVEESARTRIIKGMPENVLQKGAAFISEKLDKLGITEKEKYEGKTPDDLTKKRAGGKIKSASARADGCAIRGKTRGKMV